MCQNLFLCLRIDQCVYAEVGSEVAAVLVTVVVVYRRGDVELFGFVGTAFSSAGLPRSRAPFLHVFIVMVVGNDVVARGFYFMFPSI